MAKTLQQILGGRNLTGTIQGIRPGLPEGLLPSGLITPGTTMTVEGDAGTYRKVDGTRKTAQQAAYGSPSKARELKGVTEKNVKLVHVCENHQVKIPTLVNLESDDGNRQRLGEQQIAQQVAEMRQLLDNLRVASVFSAFGLGHVYFDINGNLLPSSASAVVDVDYGIGANNLNQLNGIIAASWATDGTDILADMRAIRNAALQTTGYPLSHVLYGDSIPEYLASNTVLKNMINGSARWAEGFAGGEIPDGFLGFRWWPVGGAFFEDQDGTNQTIFGADTCVFIPDPDPTWWGWLEGTYPVPTDISVRDDLSTALSDFTLESGMFSYAVKTTDPPGIKQVYGDTFLPVLKVPNAIFIADVTP